MAVSFSSVFSRKNMNLVVGLISLLLVLWVIMFAIPELFIRLFDTNLGNLVLVVFIFLAALYNTNLAIGLFIVFTILYRSLHMGISIESFYI